MKIWSMAEKKQCLNCEVNIDACYDRYRVQEELRRNNVHKIEEGVSC